VGGTALAVQLGHRVSVDLDFIFDGEQLNIASIKRNIIKIFPGSRILRQDHNWQIDFVIDRVKLTFFSSGAVGIPLKIIDFSIPAGKINIAEPKAVAALKFSAIAQRNTIRDYYDLYYLARYEIPLEKLISFTKEHLPNLSPVTYCETIVYTRDLAEDSIAEHLAPKEIIDKEQIAEFFRNELIRIKDSI
jgi:predicted nucleotidyltransferase component of viral defense system